MGRRTLLLITSILIAAVGTALVGIYVRGADARAQADEAQVQVAVATKNVPSGTSVKDAVARTSFDLKLFPRRLLSADTYTGAEAVRTLSTENAGKTVTTAIFIGQPILRGMFGAQSAVTQVGISPGHRGVSVELTDPQRAAGLLTPGASVEIFWTPTASGSATGGSGGSGSSEPVKVAEVVLPSVKVIAIGTERVGSPTDDAASTSSSGLKGGGGQQQDQVASTVVTLDLTEAEAKKVIAKAVTGDLHFGVINSAGP
jgi:pilus assembly protein CpaB